MNSFLFSVAICTYNRAGVIEHSIKSVLSQTISRSNYEILIIDNNCTDNTVEIVNKYSSINDNIRLVNEKNQGLSYARNRAMEEARGEIIVFIDDDAEMCTDYLSILKKVFDEEKNIGTVGGPIEVGWLGSVPEWYEPGLDSWFNYLYLGSYRREIKYPCIIYGTNMAFPAKILKEIGGFDTSLGRIGSKLLAGEEAELFIRLNKKTGLRIIYDPALKVKHLICPERLSPEYLIEKAKWTGRSHYILEKKHLKNRLFLFANPMRLLLESCWRILLGISKGNLTEKVNSAFNKGYLKEWFKDLIFFH